MPLKNALQCVQGLCTTQGIEMSGVKYVLRNVGLEDDQDGTGRKFGIGKDVLECHMILYKASTETMNEKNWRMCDSLIR